MTNTLILSAVAWADIIICSALRLAQVAACVAGIMITWRSVIK